MPVLQGSAGPLTIAVPESTLAVAARGEGSGEPLHRDSPRQPQNHPPNHRRELRPTKKPPRAQRQPQDGLKHPPEPPTPPPAVLISPPPCHLGSFCCFPCASTMGRGKAQGRIKLSLFQRVKIVPKTGESG